MLLYISILIGTGTSDGSPRLIGSNIKLQPQTGLKNTNTAHYNMMLDIKIPPENLQLMGTKLLIGEMQIPLRKVMPR